VIDGARVGMDGVLGEGASAPTAALQELGRKPVKGSVGQPGDVRNALLSAKRQQDALQRVAVGLVDGVGREPSGAAVGKVVIGQGLQSRCGCRRDDREVGQRSLLELNRISAFLASLAVL
jgi:hypothetical protein